MFHHKLISRNAILTLFLSVGTLFAQNEPRLSEQKAEATNLVDDGELASAEPIFEQITCLEPNNGANFFFGEFV